MSKKNIIFMMDVDLQDSTHPSLAHRYSSSIRAPYKFSIQSWKQWAKNNNAEIFILDEPLMPNIDMGICWQRYYLFDILEANNIEYDQVAMIDADTIVHPSCPNFFELTDNKFSVVQSDGCYEWVNRSIKAYHTYFFPKINLKTWTYFNSGFMILNKQHRDFCDKVYEFYKENQQKLVEAQKTFLVGTDQTPINFLTREHKIDLKWLPNAYNLHDPYRKNLLYIEPSNWWPDNLDNLFNSGWVYHFNAVPGNPL